MNYRIKHLRNCIWRLCLIGVIVISLPAVFQSGQLHAGLADMPYRLVPGMTSSFGVNLGSLTTSSSFIVWEDHRTGSPDVYVYDMNDGREFRISNTDDVRREPAASGSMIVWVSGEAPDRRVIRGVDLAEGVEFDITVNPDRVSRPTISPEIVAWQQRNDDRWMVHIFDRATGVTEAFGQEAQNSGRPSASGSRVVWQEHDGESWNIRSFDLESGWPGVVTDSPDDDQYPVLSGERVVFIRTSANGGPPQLIVTDLDGENERVLVSDHHIQRPAIHGDLIVWEDWRSGLPDIYAYDLQHDEMFAVARSQQANAPVISDRVIAWVSGNDASNQRVQALEIVERLPTDPQPPPAITSPDSLYFSETEQFVAGGFKSFWQAEGGPSIFGFPLTGEFTEQHPETGEEIVVQYFERVKLEYHPAAPEDQRIRLALLGYQQMPERDMPLVEPFENSETHQYFPETGQALSFGFKLFWEENGGLATFGFPVSGEFTENGRTVQYFERARFEYDPESEEEGVQLGLLGREALQARGWLPPPPVDTTQIFE